MCKDTKKLNLRYNGIRTTVVVDLLLYEYLAVSLKTHPDHDDAKTICQHWLQERLGKTPYRTLSRTVRNLIISEIADPRLENKLQKQRLAS